MTSDGPGSSSPTSGGPHTGIVGWAETDASGRSHFTAALRWVENAEHAAYRHAVPAFDISRFPRRSIEATFERPFSAGDQYRVVFTSIRVGRTSINYEWEIEGQSGIAVSGRHAVVHVVDGVPAPVPDDLRAALSIVEAPGSTSKPNSGQDR